MRHILIYNIPPDVESIDKVFEYVEFIYSDMEYSDKDNIIDTIYNEYTNNGYKKDFFLVARKRGTSVFYGLASRGFLERHYNSYPKEDYNKIEFSSLLVGSTNQLRERYR